MSGTSLDGVDYAVCQIGPDQRPALRSFWQIPFPLPLRRRLEAAARGRVSSHEVGQLHHDLGRHYALGARSGMLDQPLALAGLHGQTIFHNPDPKAPATFQIGEPAYLAESLGIPVVNNFRAADLAAGGQGAPLATLFHRLVFAESGRHVCVHNLGGISNVTSIEWKTGREPSIQAFDTGPANMLMDLAVRRVTNEKKHYDRGGVWARRGTISEKLVRRWLRHPFLAQLPPKSTGRELFGEPFLDRAWVASQKEGLNQFDLIATLAEFTARSVAVNYRSFLRSAPDTVVLAGGGAENPFLVCCLARCLKELSETVAVRTSTDLGWPSQAIEPAAFAVLAWHCYHRLPGNIPETTGARHEAILGQITGGRLHSGR